MIILIIAALELVAITFKRIKIYLLALHWREINLHRNCKLWQSIINTFRKFPAIFCPILDIYPQRFFIKNRLGGNQSKLALVFDEIIAILPPNRY